MLVPKQVFALSKLGDSEASRYALAGVRFERAADGQPFAVATDGRCLGAITWAEPEADQYPKIDGISPAPMPGFETILPIAACDQAGKFKLAARAAKAKPVLNHVLIDEGRTNGVVSMAATDLENVQRFEPRSLEGRYPRWRDVIGYRDESNSVSICLDAKALSDMLAVVLANQENRDSRATVILTIDREDSHNQPLLVTADMVNRQFAGVLMPLAVDRDNPKVLPKPAWQWVAEPPAPADDTVILEPVSQAAPEPVAEPAAPVAEPVSPAPAEVPEIWAEPVAEPVSQAEPAEVPLDVVEFVDVEPVAEPAEPAADDRDWARQAAAFVF